MCEDASGAYFALPLGKPSGVWLIQRSGETTVVCGLQSCGINDTHLAILHRHCEAPQATRQSSLGRIWIASLRSQ